VSENDLKEFIDLLSKEKRYSLLSAKTSQERQYSFRLFTNEEREKLILLTAGGNDDLENINAFETKTNIFNEALNGAVITRNSKLSEHILEVMLSTDMLIHHQLNLDAQKLIMENKHKKGRPKKDESILNYLIQIKADIDGSSFSVVWVSVFESHIEGDGKRMKSRPAIDTSMGSLKEVATILVQIFDEYGIPPLSLLGKYLDDLNLTIESIREYIKK
jgi:hypothetical protein